MNCRLIHYRITDRPVVLFTATLTLGILACDPGKSSVTATATQGDASTGDDPRETETSDDPPSTDTAAFVCEDLLSPPAFDQRSMFRIRNNGTFPIWVTAVGECFGDPAFRIFDETGDEVNYVLSCTTPLCDTVVNTTECEIGCPDCGSAAAIRLSPGATTEAPWVGRTLTQVDIPSTCASDDETCPTTCARQQQAAPGTYTVELDVYAACEGGTECECLEGDEVDGVCRLFSTAAPTGTPEVLSQSFDYPSDGEVELVFSP